MSVLKLFSKNTFLEILPEKGGCITRFCFKTKDNSFELFHPVKPSGLISEQPIEKACFPLVPFSNRIRNGNFSFQGKNIQLPLNFPPENHAIHGHGWELPWDVVDVSENSAVLEYKYLSDDWPFPYLARQIINLNDFSLKIKIQIKNTGNSPMPAGLGIHPYFVKTPNSMVAAETKKMWVNDSEKIPLKLIDAPEIKLLSKGLSVNQNVLDNLFTGWDRRAKISWPEWKVNLFISVKSPIDYLILFSPSGEDYFCVEPVSNITNAFNMIKKNTDHGTKILFPEEIFEGEFNFIPEKY